MITFLSTTHVAYLGYFCQKICLKGRAHTENFNLKTQIRHQSLAVMSVMAINVSE